MSEPIDLTEAIEEAARMGYARDWNTGREAWDRLSDERRVQWRKRVGVPVFAAAPLIERAVRERIAAEQETVVLPAPIGDLWYVKELQAILVQIARGDQ